MDQQKIGMFLKELRKEKGVTQEKFAEAFNVSNRTVSRWENGINLPDIDLMIMISDYYEIDLREILDGERKYEKMNKETEDTVIKAVDYTNEGMKRYIRKQNFLLSIAVFYWFISEVIDHTSLNETGFFSKASAWLSGVACGLVILLIFASNRKLYNHLYKYKHRLLDEWINIPLGRYKQ